MIQCGLCPRGCTLGESQTGFCGVRKVQNGKVVSVIYGQNTGLAVDPIEKKPLNHFLPGSRTLSFGSIGCNLACRFCQNARTAQSKDFSLLNALHLPEDIVRQAQIHHCESVAFTYNEPVVSAEFVQDTAAACREAGLKTVAVTNGYLSEKYRDAFYKNIDAANVDLKSFSETFYREYCSGSLEPVKETLLYLAKSTVWLEVTTLLISGLNDSDREIAELTQWFAQHLGSEVPLHFSAFHPANQMTAMPPTSPQTLFRARDRAMASGLCYVYTGNISDPAGQMTHCPQCGQTVISRNQYAVDEYHIDGESCCKYCGQTINGVFDET